ncbi:MAG: FkbM family methyltransferase [Beijerinckiaceae bacterium]
MAHSNNGYSEAELRLFAQLKAFGYAPDVVFDIGASNGVWSDLVNGIFPSAQYHLFEPLADTIATYKAPLKKLLPKRSNFTLHKVGLGDSNNVQEMAIFEGGVGSTFLEMDRIKSQQDSLKQTSGLSDIAAFNVYRLDDFVAEKKLPKPQIIKMDTQGFELAIMNGGEETIRSADILALETWLYRGYGVTTPLLHELIEPLEKLGFMLVDFGDGYWGNKHKLTAIDAFFMREGFLDKIEKTSSGWNWKIWE